MKEVSSPSGRSGVLDAQAQGSFHDRLNPVGLVREQLADAAHYPAIDLAGSISRVMNNLVSPALLKAANRFRRLWTLYQQNQDLIQVGAYETGANQDLDKAIRLRPQMESLLQQSSDESVSIDNCHAMMQQLTAVQS